MVRRCGPVPEVPDYYRGFARTKQSSGSCHTSWLLPLLPGAALMIGWQLDRFVGDRLAERGQVLTLRILTLMFAASILATCFYAIANWHLCVEMLPALRAYQIVVLLVAAALATLSALWLVRNPCRLATVFVGLAALFWSMAFADVAALRPAIDHDKTTRPLAERMESILASRGERVVGGIGLVAAPQWHVYGNYDVLTIRSRDFGTTSSRSLPRVMVVESAITDRVRTALKESGYQQIDALTVSNEKLEVFDKPASSQVAGD